MGSVAESRMLALLSLLQARRDWPGEQLAQRLGVSVRTIRRDVDRLRELGYSVSSSKGRDGGYRLAAGAELPPLLFDDDQAVALAVALQVVPGLGADLGEAAERALATVRQVMPSRLRHRLDAVGVETPAARETVGRDVLLAASTATSAREVFRFDYGDRPRRVEPHGVVAVRSRWYLVGWDLDRADWRVFRLDRVTPRMRTHARFTPRPVPGGSATALLRRRFRGSDDGDWPCVGAATLPLPAREVAPYVGDGSVEDLGPDRCRVRLGSWSWAGVAASLARFDVPFGDLDPAPLRTAVARLAERCAAAGTVRG
jgi:biotin operon repressor